MVRRRSSKRLSLQGDGGAAGGMMNIEEELEDQQQKKKKTRRMTISTGENITSAVAGRTRGKQQSQQRLKAMLSFAPGRVEEELPIPPYNGGNKKKLAPENDPYVPFKARSLPRTTGDKGAGGIVGVPKVSKRSTTVPKSPQLGARRKDMGNFSVGVDSTNRKFDRMYVASELLLTPVGATNMAWVRNRICDRQASR